MKAYLMYKDRDFDLAHEPPWNEKALIQDLELNTLLNSMARGDKFLFEVAEKAVLSSMIDPDAILYRQEILEDCLKNRTIVRNLYALALESIEREKKFYFSFLHRFPSSILHSSIEVMRIYVGILKRLRAIADEHADKFASDGFTTLFAMLRRELDDDYFVEVQNHLQTLKFRAGVLISAELGTGNKGEDYILRKPHPIKLSQIGRILAKLPFARLFLKPPGEKRSWINWFFGGKHDAFTFCIHSRDENGARALSELKGRGINLVANALAQSASHILSFFEMLRTELAFYVGCLNLHEELEKMMEPTCFPLPVVAGERRHSFNGLYDVCLALKMGRKVVGNDVNADARDLVIVTGANQGGKSTFLRSIGLSQLMMQCGMFVPAERFSANVCHGLFTHYKREEDTSMKRGKLDEELSRISDIADHLVRNSMVLFNESFAATNEREGSEIARQITYAFLEKGIKVFFVTHQYEFAHRLYEDKMENAFFLRAERQADGKRTFRLMEGAPLETSFGEDLYRRIFQASSQFEGLTEGKRASR
jgi:DNA mismatch repair ATPase MutS